MYTHFRLGHTRKMKYNPCFKRGYLLAGELRHQHRKQLGICTRQCVMLLSNLISMDKSSYISHIYFFQNSICIQHQATAVHTVSSAPASPGTTLLVGEGQGVLSPGSSLSAPGVLSAPSICSSCILQSSLYFLLGNASLLQPPVTINKSLY